MTRISKALKSARDLRADPAQPDDADRPAGNIDRAHCLPLPAPGAGGGIGVRDLARDAEQERDGVLGGGDRIGARGVQDEYAGPGRRIEIDVVDADPSPSDHAQVGASGEHLLGDLGFTAHHQGVGIAHGGEQGRDIGAIDIDDARGGGKSLAGSGIDRIADDDRGACSAGIMLIGGRWISRSVSHGLGAFLREVSGDDVKQGVEVIGGGYPGTVQ